MIKYIVLVILLLCPFNLSAHTMKELKDKGFVACGIYRDGDTLNIDEEGIEAIFCKITAIAVFGAEDAVEIVPLDGELRWPALYDGTVDLLYASSSWTLERDTQKRLTFASIYLFDNQIMVTQKESGIKKITDAPPDTKICTTDETSLIPNLKRFIKKFPDKHFSIIPVSSVSGVKRSLIHDVCPIISEESNTLVSMFKNCVYYDKLAILPEIVSMQPLSSAVMAQDTEFKKLLKWTMNGLIRAEEKGITKANLDKIIKSTKDKEILFMLGEIKGIGKGLHLDDKWLYRVIKKYGNYGEIFNQTLYDEYNMKRDNNALYKNGGLLVSYPFY